MSQLAPRWTAEQVRNLPADGSRYELVSGELVVTPTPLPAHQVALLRLYAEIGPYLAKSGVGRALCSPADLSLGEDEVLQPDLFVFPVVAPPAPREWRDIRRLRLVVEVTSASTARYDRLLKRHRYQRAAVPEYWIVDLDAQLIERWRPGERSPEILSDEISWQPLPGVPPLVIDLPAMFTEVIG